MSYQILLEIQSIGSVSVSQLGITSVEKIHFWFRTIEGMGYLSKRDNNSRT